MNKLQLTNVFVILILSFGLAQAMEINPGVELVSLYNSTAFVQRVQSLNTADRELTLLIPNQADPDTLLVIDSGAEIMQLSVVSQSTKEVLKDVKVQMLQANIGKEVQLVTEKFSVKGLLKKIVWDKYLVISSPVLYNGSLNIPATNDFVLAISEVVSMSLSVVPEIAELEGADGVLDKKVLSVSEQVLRPQRNLQVKYFVSQAGWKPVYQLFLNSEDKAKLIYYAKAFNNTDEDWENIKLKIIAGNPNMKAPLYRDYGYATRTLAGGMENKMMPMPTAADDQFVSSEAEQLHSYGLKRFVSIKQQSNSLIPILSETVPIEKEYRWNARWAETVDYYLRLVNETEEPLAEGWLSVYSDSAYVGGNYLPWTQTDANNSIYLSQALDIKVKKTDSRKVTKKPGVTVTDYSAVLSLENHKKEEAKVKVTDYLPADAENFTSNTPYHETADGLAEWTVTLKAGQKYDITYSYKQSYYEQGYPVAEPFG